jgi:hypothetical protein
VRTLTPRESEELATCAITEMGFVRVLAQAAPYGFTAGHAKAVLLRLKGQARPRFRFLADDHDISQLPVWVKTPKQITGGHLVFPVSTVSRPSTELDGEAIFPACRAFPVLGIARSASLLRASFRPRPAARPLRFAITSPPSGCEEDLHLPAVDPAGHTKNEKPGRAARALTFVPM